MAEQKKQYPPFVAYHFLNIDGELMAMEESGKNTEKFLQHGFNIDGSSIKGMASVEKSDLTLRPEPDSYKEIKIGDFVHHRFLAHFEDDQGKPYLRDPKAIFQRVIDKCRGMGFEPYMFSEVEFYIVDKKTGKPVDDAGYCDLPPKDASYDYRHQLGEICEELGIAVKRIHHECGPAQDEIELDFQPCMKNADDTTLCRWIMDMLADQRGQKIIYSPKPFKTVNGNGLHHHILLKDMKTGDNIFYNKEFKGNVQDPKTYMERISQYHKYFTAGLLKYADEITAVFGQSPESFKRLKPGFEAPISKTWDFSNRTALVRVPKSTLEMTRMEYRGGDYSGSVHLYGAILLAAGLKGIEEKLEVPPNSNFNVDLLTEEEAKAKNVHKVPLSFEETLKVFKSSAFVREALGDDMVDHFICKLSHLTAKKEHGHH